MKKRRRSRKGGGGACSRDALIILLPESYRAAVLVTFATFEPQWLTEGHRLEIEAFRASLPSDDASHVFQKVACYVVPRMARAITMNGPFDPTVDWPAFVEEMVRFNREASE